MSVDHRRTPRARSTPEPTTEAFLTPSFFERLQLGLHNAKPRWRVLAEILAVNGALWGVLEPLLGLSAGAQQLLQSPAFGKYLIYLGISITIGILKMAAPTSINICIPGSNTLVIIQVGDLFDFDGHRVIPVNDLFDSALGDRVSSLSVHGQCIQKLFGNDPRSFEKAVSLSLRDEAPIELGGNDRRARYPIGTTAVVSWGSDRLFLTALSETDRTSHKAQSDAALLWQTLACLWKKVRLYSNGKPIAVPLIGGGQSGIDMPYSLLIRYIIMSICESTRRNGIITNQIKIIITNEAFRKLDLPSLVPEFSEENLL